MFGYYSIIGLLQKSTLHETEPLPVLEIGSLIWIETLCYGKQLGKVEAIVENPFYGESGMSAYVCGNGWNEYVPVEVEVKS